MDEAFLEARYYINVYVRTEINMDAKFVSKKFS